MDLRLATIDDLPDLIALCVAFVEESPYDSVDESYLTDQIELFLQEPHTEKICILLETENQVVGFLAGTVFTTMFSPEKMAVELAWYVKPEFRKGKDPLRLVQAFEYWGKKVGCTKISLATLANERINKVYKRFGYNKIEDVFIKDIK